MEGPDQDMNLNYQTINPMNKSYGMSKGNVDIFNQYNQCHFKRSNINKKKPLLSTTYRADFCRFNYNKGNTRALRPILPKQDLSRCFKNTNIVRKNKFVPKYACQNNIVNRIYNRTLENLYIRPKKTYSQSLPFLQNTRSQRFCSNSVNPMPYNTITEENLFNSRMNRTTNSYDQRNIDTLKNSKYNYDESMNYINKQVKESEIPPLQEDLTHKKNVSESPKKMKKNETKEEEPDEFYRPYIPKKEEFIKPSILNNYKPYLLDNFYRYGEY